MWGVILVLLVFTVKKDKLKMKLFLSNTL